MLSARPPQGATLWIVLLQALTPPTSVRVGPALLPWMPKPGAQPMFARRRGLR